MSPHDLRVKYPTATAKISMDRRVFSIYYRPQRSWAKVIFSQACFKNSVHTGGGRVSASVHAEIHPPRSRHPLGADTPLEQTHPPGSRPPRSRHSPGSTHPPGADTGGKGVCLSACWIHTPSRSRHPPPLGADTPSPGSRLPLPREQTPPGADTPPPRDADCSIRSTSGRYASYWNAFLYI